MNTSAIADRPAAQILKDSRWASVVARDRAADGKFYFSVKTTGVYCRPSCGARLARPENVRFHASCKEAEAAGFRPCKRCRPDQASLQQQHAVSVAEACRQIEQSESGISLDELAQHTGLSKFHFQRVFKRMTGLTPKNYAAACRASRMRSRLQSKNSIAEAIFEAGYSSCSRFYEKSNELLGMTPSAFRSGGVNYGIRFAIGQCSLGAILVAHSGKGVCAILMGDDPDALLRNLQDRFPNAELSGGDKDFEEIIARVVGFVETPAIGLDLPLDIRGTVFQQRVWQALREIPVGKTASYTEIASRIGTPKSVRAVAAACAANVLALAIPCHRVVRTDGALSGYRWGVERKRRLLQREVGDAPES